MCPHRNLCSGKECISKLNYVWVSNTNLTIQYRAVRANWVYPHPKDDIHSHTQSLMHHYIDLAKLTPQLDDLY